MPPPAALGASPSALPWHWIIETLADTGVDTSILSAAISVVPGFWTEASEVVRERLALRYLQECSGSGRGFEAAGSSEEVLCSLLRKDVDLGGLQRHGAELSSHDLRQFIFQKKTALPKSSLDLLRESSLESLCGTDLFLKEISGLLTLHQIDHLQCNNDDEREQVNMLKLSTANGQNHSRIQHSVILHPDSSYVNLQEEPSGSEKHLLQQNGGTRIDVHGDACTGGTDVQFLEKSPQNQLSENVGCNGGKIQSTKLVEVNNHVDTPGLDSCNMSLQDPSSSQQQLPMMESSPSMLTRKQNICLKHTPVNGSRKNVIQPICQSDHFDGEVSVVPETPSDGSISDNTPSNFDPNDEIIISEKSRLLSSQTHANPDFVAGKCSGSEQVLCVKCDKGGQMLSCSAEGCLIAVHESCLDPSVSFQGTDVFYCPFCSYTRAAIAYCKARKTVSQARKDLSAFVGRDLVKGRRKRLPSFSILRETTQAGVNEEMDHRNSSHSHEYQRKKSKVNQHHGSGDGNVCHVGNLSSRYLEAFQVVRRDDISRTSAEPSHGDGVNHHQKGTDMQHLNTAANVVSNDKLPSGVRVAAPLCEKADVSVINMNGEACNGCEFSGVEELQHPGQPNPPTGDDILSHDGMDPYDTRNYDATSAPQKDMNCSANEHVHVEQLRAAPDKDTGTGAPDSLPSKYLRKRRYDAATCKTLNAQENVENAKRKKYSSGSSSKPVIPEYQQVTSVPDHADDPETLNSHTPECHAKRSRPDGDIGKIYDPFDSFEKPKRRKPSSSRSSKRVAPPKCYSNQRIILGRRQKLFWTSEEEETLKEAIQRFPIDSNGNYPWRKILEFGRHVFHTTRQPGDLKDKWRNIKKKEVKDEM